MTSATHSIPALGEHCESSASDSADLIGQLFHLHAAFLLRVVERLVGPGAHVEDIVQETFLVAHRKRARLLTVGDTRAWLCGTAIYLTRHHRRSLARQFRRSSALVERGVDPETVSPEEEVERRQRARLVRACIQSLPAKQREIFVLFEMENMSGQSVAQALRIPENTVWSRLHHARKRFRELWESSQGNQERQS